MDADKEYGEWNYSDPWIRQGLESGTYHVDQAVLCKDYLAWVNNASVVTLRNIANGETIQKLSPKRGNLAYALNQKRRLVEIEQGFDGLQLDQDSENSRGVYKDCIGLFLTFTYDHKVISCQDAWSGISADLANFKKRLREVLHLSSMVSISVKEGSLSGYPAPHMFVLLDRPLRSFRYHGKWRVQSQEVVNKLKQKWKGGFIDIQTVVDNKIGRSSVIHYAFKYLTKTVKADNTLAVTQMAYQKLYQLRGSHIAAAWKALMNPKIRLDILLHESPEAIAAYWIYESAIYCNLADFWKVICEVGEFAQQKKKNAPRDWGLGV